MQTEQQTQYCVAYARVSTAGQANEGISLETQHARIVNWAAANGYQLLVAHTDAGLSGGKADNRPGLQAALADACKHKAALVVYSLSRLARSTKDAIAISERLHKAGADLVSLTERIDTTNAAGKMVFRMMAVLAEFERDLISERTSAALQHLIHVQNRRVGEIRYGFDLSPDGTTLISNETEQGVITKIKVLRERKNLPFGTIATLLNTLRIPAKQQGQWHRRVVQAVYERACA